MQTRNPGAPSAPAEGDVRTLSARSLLGSSRLLRIEHEGEIYTLRLTRNNRLILTK
jgi:hemin uptake protein HemP